jgi:hypothetical protein
MLPLRLVLALLVIAASALAGCTPRDPLDWKISAKTPAHFEEWRDQDLARLPEAQQAEFNRAFSFFSSTAPRALESKDMNATSNPLYRRVNGRTIRSVILEGLDLEKRALYARIYTESDNMVRNAQLTATRDDPETARKVEKARVGQAANIAAMKLRVQEIDDRVKALSPQ